MKNKTIEPKLLALLHLYTNDLSQGWNIHPKDGRTCKQI